MSAETPSGSVSTCPQHPGTVADFVCGHCQTPVCVECCYGMPNGSVCCKSCYHAEPKTEAAGVPTPQPQVSSLRLARSEPTPQVSRSVVAPLPGQGCVQHPNVKAVAKCRECDAGVCRTCDFLFPVNLHYCPVCVAASTGKLSPRRKKYMIAAYILAAWSSIGLVCFLAGVASDMAEGEMGDTLLGLLLLLLVGLPVIIGTALGMSARRAGGPNPVSIWIAFIWNILLLVGLVLLIIVGNMME